jgi:THO complex subunit 5
MHAKDMSKFLLFCLAFQSWSTLVCGCVEVINEAILTLSNSHKYTSLPLISVEEFLTLFPEHAELPAHELMIARIEHEHVERQALEEKRQGLLKRKQGLIAENNRRKEDLANLDKDLEKFIEAAGPIVKTFEKEY